jgi:hypothetical protein
MASSLGRPLSRHPCRMPTRRLATWRSATWWSNAASALLSSVPGRRSFRSARLGPGDAGHRVVGVSSPITGFAAGRVVRARCGCRAGCCPRVGCPQQQRARRRRRRGWVVSGSAAPRVMLGHGPPVSTTSGWSGTRSRPVNGASAVRVAAPGAAEARQPHRPNADHPWSSQLRGRFDVATRCWLGKTAATAGISAICC